jgi:hypothetical protein
MVVTMSVFICRRRETNVTATEANIQFLKPSTVYIFRVYAVNSHGFSKQPAQLSVTTQAEGWWLFILK